MYKKQMCPFYWDYMINFYENENKNENDTR